MVLLDFKNRRNWIIAGLVAFFVLFAVWLRLLPMLTMGHTDILTMVGSDDPLYNLRQVEQLLANHFTYTWFDPMTRYPVGGTIYWGPLFIYISGFALPDCRCRDAPGNHQYLPSCTRCNGCGDRCPDVLCRKDLRRLEDRDFWLRVLPQLFQDNFFTGPCTVTSITISVKCSFQHCSVWCISISSCQRKMQRST